VHKINIMARRDPVSAMVIGFKRRDPVLAIKVSQQ
jgi:hypothetical protein